MGAVAVAVRRVVLLGAVMGSLAACKSTPPQDVTGIRLGMTKAELTTTLGQPTRRDDPFVAEDGSVEEVWYYRLENDAESGKEVAMKTLTSGTRFFDDPTEADMHAFVFVDNRLVRWGAAPPR